MNPSGAVGQWTSLALAVVAWSCGAGSGGAADELGMGDQGVLEQQEVERELTLEVENQNFYDANLYAVTLGAQHRQRIGYIRAYNRETFKFRWIPSFELRIEIDLVSAPADIPRGAGTTGVTRGQYLTPPMAVSEGDQLRLVIEPDLHRKAPTRP